MTLSRLESESRRPSTSTSTRVAATAPSSVLAAAFFLAGALGFLAGAGFDAAGFDAAMLASSAAIRSGTFSGSFVGSSITIVSPCALRSIRSSTRSRYSSWYFSGSKSEESESISWRAIVSSRSVVLTVASVVISSSESVGTTSSAKSIVSIASTPSRGRMATRFSLERITTRAIATFPASSMASTSSW